MHHYVTKEMLRTPSEHKALRLGLLGFAAVGLILSIPSLGLVGASIVIAFVLGILSVTFRRSALQRQCLMISPKQLPRLDGVLQEAADRLSYAVPNVFVQQTPQMNAYALSLFGNEAMVIYSGLIEACQDRELQFVIGHELTHMKCGHTFWRILANQHPVLRMPVLSKLCGLFLQWWSRQAELTADRGGLLACADPGVAIRALLRLAVGKTLADEVDVEQFLRQSVMAESNPLSSVSRLVESHPDIGNRIRNLLQFAESQEYQRLTAGHRPRSTSVVVA